MFTTSPTTRTSGPRLWLAVSVVGLLTAVAACSASGDSGVSREPDTTSQVQLQSDLVGDENEPDENEADEYDALPDGGENENEADERERDEVDNERDESEADESEPGEGENEADEHEEDEHEPGSDD